MPVKALGKLLAKAQMTEEVKHSCDDDATDDNGCPDDEGPGGNEGSKDSKESKDETIDKFNDLIHYDHSIFPLLSKSSSPGSLSHPANEDLLHLFKKDIHCPPPNC
ncbi:hypothetical protein GCM10023093_04240 [Nemorincola caseinilytica]|uniref:Uncharacterized protein n=1 Tax=Nemorincola caseinilytica TaxID=2054315 RepID=A0ABP8N3T1_9BACT